MMWACGISWSLPSTPFARDGNYQFRYWESLGNIKVSEKLEIPLHIGFNPAGGYSPILGRGWTFALFDSRIEQIDDKTYLMKLPDGSEEELETTNKAGILKGRGWIGEMKGQQITCKASCGWQMIFQKGLLQQMKSPDGVVLRPVLDGKGGRSLLANGTSIVTLTPDWDAETTLKYYRLNFGGEKYLLKMGMRPVLIKKKEKPDWRGQEESLVSIRNSRGERKFSIIEDQFRIDDRLYKWDNSSMKLIQDGTDKLSVVSVSGVQCLKRTLADGRFTIEGRDLEKNTSVNTTNEGIVIITEFLNTNILFEKPKNVFHLNKDGSKELKKRYFYDENFNVTRIQENDSKGSRIYIFGDQKVSCLDAVTNQTIWEKQFDDKKRITKYASGTKIYLFKYENDNNVKMTVIDQHGTKEKYIASEKLQSILNLL
jgi:hypothetical protein